MVIPSTLRGRPTRDPQAQVHSRLSAWFHGHSIIGDDRSWASRAAKFQRSRGRSTSHDRSTNPTRVSGLRSPSSTRSIIDPTSSPIVGSDPGGSGFLDRIHREEALQIGGTRYDDENIAGVTGESGTRTRLVLSRPRRKAAATTPRRRCFPSFKNNKVKRKAIGCLVSGGLLAIILTTCKSRPSPDLVQAWLNNVTDLALAISNSGNGETFHAILIMLILIVTIIFCHYLIRLCMLTVRSKRRDPSGELVDQSRAGAIARPREPIRVILARDEELGLHERNVVEEDKEIAVPPPPPAYGLWRCSVVSITAVSRRMNYY